MPRKEPFAPSLFTTAPTICDQCGWNAEFVKTTPDSNGRPYAYQMFRCTRCQARTVRTVAIRQQGDEKIEAPAKRKAGRR